MHASSIDDLERRIAVLEVRLAQLEPAKSIEQKHDAGTRRGADRCSQCHGLTWFCSHIKGTQPTRDARPAVCIPITEGLRAAHERLKDDNDKLRKEIATWRSNSRPG